MYRDPYETHRTLHKRLRRWHDTVSHRNRFTLPIAFTAASALVLSACGGGDDSPAADEGGSEGGSFTVWNCEPQSLTPGDSSEVCGARVLEQVFTGLTEMDYEEMEAIPGVAEDWESEDNVSWTFTLGEDWTFHNGDEVTAQSFVDAFNYTVDPDNAQANAEYYENFVGYDDVVDGETDELEGVSAPDDHTLEIELEEPFGQLPNMLSLVGFSPLPEVAFDDMDAFESSPIGNGRYQMDGDWVHDTEIHVERYDDWPGENPGLADNLEWKIYSDVSTAYMDVQAGELDILEDVPPENIDTMEGDFPDTHEFFETGTLTYLGFPTYLDDFAEEDVRHALSMAIDREEILESIFSDTMTPARSFLPPVLEEGREDACGEYCEFDPDAAADLYEEAGGPSELTVLFNSGAGHDEWVEAVTNQWQQHLPVDDVSFESMEFAQYLDDLAELDAAGPYRLGWTLSYPSAQESLEPMYSSTASRNYTGYGTDEFDDLMAEANASDPEDAVTAYQDAEDVLIDAMPSIPLWFEDQRVVHSDRVDNLGVTPRGLLQVERVEVTED